MAVNNIVLYCICSCKEVFRRCPCKETIICMAAGNDKDVYIAVTNDDASKSIIHIDTKGKQEKYSLPAIDKDRTIPYITSMFLSNGYIYLAADSGMYGNGQHLVLYKIDLKKQETEIINEYPGYRNASKLMFLDGTLLMLVQDKNRKNIQPVLQSPDERFDYYGEVLISQEGSVLFDSFPVACDVLDKSSIIMYAHSDEKGFYFVDLTIKNGVVTKKVNQYTGI